MLLSDLYRRDHRRYSSLPILGPVLEEYASWLFNLGYPRHRLRQHLRSARRLVCHLREIGVHSPEDLSPDRLWACAPASSQDDPNLTVLVRMLNRYLEDVGVFAVQPPTRTEATVALYRRHLAEVRGLALSTVTYHSATAAEFLESLGYEDNTSLLSALTRSHIEAFVCTLGKRLSRASLQHCVGHLRSFLRFLVARGLAPAGLDAQIDSPRLYRGEQLPRSLRWETVQALLQSIDRSTALGRRDYAMLLLMASYGLRACEVVALTLDDIDWRAERISIPQRKTGSSLLLPLTNEIGISLLDYLQRGRPPVRFRQVFLRHRAPEGVLKPTALADVFQKWSRRSGLDIPYQGPHCLRHSYAVHLLREGTPLKTLGDLLGHRSAESTCVYIRLAIEDLRDVALPLPVAHALQS